MDRYTYAHVCGSSEPEYTNSWKDFIFGPRLEEGGGGGGETRSFQFSSRGEYKISKSVWGEQMFFQNTFPISGAPPPPRW